MQIATNPLCYFLNANFYVLSTSNNKIDHNMKQNKNKKKIVVNLKFYFIVE